MLWTKLVITIDWEMPISLSWWVRVWLFPSPIMLPTRTLFIYLLIFLVFWTNCGKLQSQTITLDSGFLFPHTPCPMLFCRFKKISKEKSTSLVATLKEGKRGGLSSEGGRDFWLRLYSLYMLGISMGLFQACHVIDFQKDIIKTAKRKQTWTTTGNYQ